MIQYIYEQIRPRPRRARRHRDPLSRRAAPSARSARCSGLSEDVTAALARHGVGLGRRRRSRSDMSARAASIPTIPTLRLALDARRASWSAFRAICRSMSAASSSPAGCSKRSCRSRTRRWRTAPSSNGTRTIIDALGMLKIDVLALGMLTCIRRAFDLIAAAQRRALDAGHGARAKTRRSTRCCATPIRRRVPGREPGADEHAAAPQAARILRSGDRGGDRAAGADPGRHGASLSAPPRRDGAGRVPVAQSGAATRGAGQDHGRAALPGAGDAHRHGRRGLHARPRPNGCAAPWRRSATTATSRISATSSSMAWRRTAISATSPSAASIRSRASAITAFPESHAASFALLVYVSAWIKRFHPEVFAAALLNSQPMGFYAPAQIVRDAARARR